MAKIQNSLLRLWFYSIVLAFFTIWPEKLLFHAKVILIYSYTAAISSRVRFYEALLVNFCGQVLCSNRDSQVTRHTVVQNRKFCSKTSFILIFYINVHLICEPPDFHRLIFWPKKSICESLEVRKSGAHLCRKSKWRTFWHSNVFENNFRFWTTAWRKVFSIH